MWPGSSAGSDKFPVVVDGANLDGVMAVRSGSATLDVRADKPRPRGGPAVLAVRPENMRLREADSPAPNGMTGTVTEVSFLGESIDYQVLIDGRPVTVNENPSVIFPVGSDVRVEFESEHGLLYDDEPPTTESAPVAEAESVLSENGMQ